VQFKNDLAPKKWFKRPIGATNSPGDAIVPALYIHDRYGTQPLDQHREFTAFVSSFDGADDDDGDGIPDTLGILQWVAYQISRYEGEIESSRRPSSWATDDMFNH